MNILDAVLSVFSAVGSLVSKKKAEGTSPEAQEARRKIRDKQRGKLILLKQKLEEEKKKQEKSQ